MLAVGLGGKIPSLVYTELQHQPPHPIVVLYHQQTSPLSASSYIFYEWDPYYFKIEIPIVNKFVVKNDEPDFVVFVWSLTKQKLQK